MRSPDTRNFQHLAPMMCVVLLFSASCRWVESEIHEFKAVRTIAGPESGLGEPFGVALLGESIYFSDGEKGGVYWKSAKSGLPIVQTEGLDTPSGIAVDSERKIVVADSGRHAIYSADLEPVILAGVENGAGFADGETSSARFNGPTGVAVIGDRILVSDTYNDRIRAIQNGSVSTLAGGKRGYADGIKDSAQFDTPLGIAMWGERLLVADSGNRRIRVVEPDGRVWTLAGNGGSDLVDGFPLQASFVRPTAIAVGPDGAIYIADGNAIRVIGRRSFAFVETIAGDTGRGFRDGSPRTAQFNRPSGLAFDSEGRLLVADSDNGVIRTFDFTEPKTTAKGPTPREYTAEEFRALQPPRWPFDPPEAARDIAGTLGEIRGDLKDESSQVWFHNGLDIAGAYGETARFIRDEKVLDPMAADNFGTLRELLRMPSIGYIHIRLGRDKDDRLFGDPRFIFSNDLTGKLNDVRVPRGASFKAGEPIGTLNAMNHVHMIAGPVGGEMNALAALSLPGVRDSIPPVIESATVFDEGWAKIETQSGSSRIRLSGRSRLVVQAFDRMDGNPARRKLGVYRVGYQILTSDASPLTEPDWTISFERNPPNDAVKTVYAIGSRSGYTAETAFEYIVTNRLHGDTFGDDLFDASRLEPGNYVIRAFAADFFGNQVQKDIQIEVIR